MVAMMREQAMAGALVVAFTTAACGGGDAGELDAAQPDSGAATRTVNVEVRSVQPRSFTTYVRVVGTVEAERDVVVAAEETGRVRRTLAEKGALVRAGQPIAAIDDAVLSAQVDQAEASAELARETWERQKQLWEEEQIGTELQYLQARYNAMTAAAQARALRARLANTVVRAPFAGVLEDRFVDVGDMVAPGTPVARVLDMTPVKVTGGVAERYAGDLTVGAPARITLDALGGEAHDGEIGYVGASVDADARTFAIEVLVPNPDGRIKPGMVAGVRIVLDRLDGVLVVPQQAVIRHENSYVVYVVRVDGEGVPRAEAVPVALGPRQMDETVIRSGLEAGDRVVVVGQQQIASGDALRIVGGGDR